MATRWNVIGDTDMWRETGLMGLWASHVDDSIDQKLKTLVCMQWDRFPMYLFVSNPGHAPVRIPLPDASITSKYLQNESMPCQNECEIAWADGMWWVQVNHMTRDVII